MSDQRLDVLEKWREQMDERFAEAFPAGDYAGHRRYHELMIEEIAAKKKLREAVMEKTVAGLVWFIVAGVAIACWQYVKSLVMK